MELFKQMAYFLQDQAVPQGSRTVSVNIPINWENQSACVDVFQVKPESQEWTLITEKFTTVLPVVIKQVTRIQNLWLWEAYCFNKYRMVQKNSGIHNELILYHENNPMAICKGEDGFDLRLGSKGSWGIALYFSESVCYADRFAHITSEGDREILVASVLVGEAYDFGTAHSRDLRMPPVRETSKENLENIKYDSVSAITKDTRVYMLYEMNKAYPAYHVRYQYQHL